MPESELCEMKAKKTTVAVHNLLSGSMHCITQGWNNHSVAETSKKRCPFVLNFFLVCLSWVSSWHGELPPTTSA